MGVSLQVQQTAAVPGQEKPVGSKEHPRVEDKTDEVQTQLPVCVQSMPACVYASVCVCVCVCVCVSVGLYGCLYVCMCLYKSACIFVGSY